MSSFSPSPIFSRQKKRNTYLRKENESKAGVRFSMTPLDKEAAKMITLYGKQHEEVMSYRNVLLDSQQREKIGKITEERLKSE